MMGIIMNGPPSASHPSFSRLVQRLLAGGIPHGRDIDACGLARGTVEAKEVL